MDYLLLQIFWFLLIAFLLGLAIGWFVGKGKSAVAEPDPAAARRIAELEAEITRLKAPRGTPIEDIEGIGQGFGKQLRADGIASTEKLLEVCRTEARGRYHTGVVGLLSSACNHRSRSATGRHNIRMGRSCRYRRKSFHPPDRGGLNTPDTRD